LRYSETSGKQVEPVKPETTLNDKPLFKLQMGGSMVSPETTTDEMMKQKITVVAQLMQKGATEPKQVMKALEGSEFGNMQEDEILGIMKFVTEKMSSNNAPKFKKGGKAKALMCKKGGCACMKCGGKAKMYRRGGELDLGKKNVIVDGPSHDDYNKTGVKKDKGLPVVKDGKKVAEIESKELVIDADSVKKIEQLKKKVASGDEAAKKELADFMYNELKDNTYDYSDLLK